MTTLSFANRYNAELIDEYYELWSKDRQSVDPQWQAFFEGFELAKTVPTPSKKSSVSAPASSQGSTFYSDVIGAIDAYRAEGHTQAHLNPLAPKPDKNPRLSLERLGLGDMDFNTQVHATHYLEGKQMPLRELIDRLNKTYCHTVGCEYLHITNTDKRRWLQARMEPNCNVPQFSKNQKLRILKKVIEAESLEQFLHTTYVGQKRFSVEGGESFIAGMDAIIQKAPALGVEEFAIAMAHRGRLNTLANILGKPFETLLTEFSPGYTPAIPYGSGDVKYHLGYENDIQTEDGKSVHVTLACNPSHLEAVNPILEGKTRARQKARNDIEHKKVVPVLIHGDAAIVGQGIVSETLNLCRILGYGTGGTLHVIINNQIGFTANPFESRSSRYCTDMCKGLEIPVFHVNGDDPLALAMVMELALEYRQQFSEDVFIDIVCYRKYGHNESDEPLFTQPLLYQTIKQHKPVSAHLTEQLKATNDYDEAPIRAHKDDYLNRLKSAAEKVKNKAPKAAKNPPEVKNYDFKGHKTAISTKALKAIATALTTIPEDFNINSKIKRQLDAKATVIQEGKGFDWSLGEALAFGSLLLDGHGVRLSGQDSIRGTFSHRHAVLYDQNRQSCYCPLNNIEGTKARIEIYNSSLSEGGVLGFEYGYSLAAPKDLCIWEAQFGDFVNGAQIQIDQFITSGETKWHDHSGLVMLLPHGYEGQGPEHSSGRLERFLQACAEDNIQVINPTTPAQLFHALRRQVKLSTPKPLVVMTPKSLLRHKACVSTIQDFTQGSFQEILDDPVSPKNATRLVLCSGKVFYDLLEHREAKKIKNTALIRVEQFYPTNAAQLSTLCKQYTKAKKIVWCQEEPQNMGGWSFIAPILEAELKAKPIYAGRKGAASPAVGAPTLHKIEQQTLVEQAFTL